MKLLLYLICAAAGYLIGSISTGVVVSKLYAKVDIRSCGSGNIGMTNVMRTLGWFPSLLTFVGDALKGVLGALIGKWIGGEVGLHLGGLAAIIGHNWPVLFGFKGGKGMSTSFGYILVASWPTALFLLAVQLVVVFITGYMSLASICSSIAYALCGMLSGNPVMGLFAVVVCALALYSHRENIKRLRLGRENRLDVQKINKISQKFKFKRK